MGTCKYCSKPAGFLRSKHKECEEQHLQQLKIIENERKQIDVVIRVETSIMQSASDTINTASDDEEKDNWERFDFYSARMLPAKGRYRINYEDQRGLKTERDIEVKRVHENAGKYAIDAHCLLRNAHRSFLNERIQMAVNLDDDRSIENLALDAMSQYKGPVENHSLTAIGKEWTAVAILVFVCRADGQMRKEERVIIADYIKRHSPDVTLDDTELDNEIKALWSDPDPRKFKRMIRDFKAAGDNERLNDLYDCANQIASTQKTVAPMEKAALEILKEATT